MPRFGGPFLGTPVFNAWARTLGAKIGKGVWLESHWLPETDLVHLEDGATVNRGCVLQTHLFHDRLMRISAVHLGRGATLGPRGVVLPGASIGAGTSVGAGSLVMRGESLPAGTQWTGNPVTAVEASPMPAPRPEYLRTGEFLGRADGEVKIRGYRVELSEIEVVLAEHPEIHSASVCRLQRDGLEELAAYVVTNHNQANPDPHEVLSLLESRVPPYMIPGYLDVVDELPRTTSGKVDRRALPQPVCPLARVFDDAACAETDSERLVAEIWAEVLGIRDVPATADFFVDLGGHSLVAAQMVRKVREITGCPLTVRDAYEFTTVRGLTAHLNGLLVAVPPTGSGVFGAAMPRSASSR